MKRFILCALALFLSVTGCLHFIVPSNAVGLVTGLVSGDKYYISNYSTGRYLTPVSSSQVSGVGLCTNTPNGLTLSQWQAAIQNDNTVELWNVYSNYGMRLANSSGTPVISNSALSSDYRFTVTRITSGTYEGLYTISINSKYLTQRTSTYNYEVYLADTPISRSYWSFIEVSRDSALLFSFAYGSYNSTLNNSSFESAFDGMYYDAFAMTNEEAEFGYEMLYDDETDIWVIHDHGAPCNVAFYTGTGYIDGLITVNSSTRNDASSNGFYIASLTANALAEEKVVLFLACETGESIGSYNLVDVTFNKGAHFVLGVIGSVATAANTAFLATFINCMYDDNLRISSCVSQARLAARASDASYEIYYRGDGRQNLNPS